MLRTIRKLLGEKSNQIKFPIALMGADAVLSIVLYVVLYMTVIQLLGNTLTAGKIVIYTAICFSYTINIQHLLSLVKLLNPRRIHRNVRL